MPGLGLIGSVWWVAPGRMMVVAAGSAAWVLSAVPLLSCTLLCSARMTVVCAVEGGEGRGFGALARSD